MTGICGLQDDWFLIEFVVDTKAVQMNIFMWWNFCWIEKPNHIDLIIMCILVLGLGLRILCSKNSQLFYSCILTKYKYYAFSINTYAQQNVYYSQFSCHRTCKWHNRKISKWKQASVYSAPIFLILPLTYYAQKICRPILAIVARMRLYTEELIVNVFW